MVNKNKLKVSKMLNYIFLDNKIFCYHSLYGNLTALTQSQYNFLLNYDQLKPDNIKSNSAFIRNLINNQYIYPDSEENIQLQKRELFFQRGKKEFKGIIIKTTDHCNFSCSYCIDKNSNSRTNIMKSNTAIKILEVLDLSLDNTVQLGEFVIGFIGGEPLINFKMIEYFVARTNEINSINAVYDINTNASLINDRIAKFLSDNKFSVKTSLDGLLFSNDKQRINRNNHSAFEQTVKGIKLLNDNSVQEIVLIVVLTNSNLSDINNNFFEFIRKELNISNVIIEPDLFAKLDLSPKQLAKKIYNFKNECRYKFKINISGQWYKPFLNLVEENRNDVPSYCGGISGYTLNIFPNGDIRVCNYLDSEYTIANIDEINSFDDIYHNAYFNETIYKNFGGLIDSCSQCNLAGHCRGNCYVLNEYCSKNNCQEIKDYQCSFIKEITQLLLEEYLQAFIQ